ncbi:unnamed protein product, partial [Prorocentrum cordatum]
EPGRGGGRARDRRWRSPALGLRGCPVAAAGATHAPSSLPLHAQQPAPLLPRAASPRRRCLGELGRLGPRASAAAAPAGAQGALGSHFDRQRGASGWCPRSLEEAAAEDAEEDKPEMFEGADAADEDVATPRRWPAAAAEDCAAPSSTGSAGHPEQCGPPCKYVRKTRGCKERLGGRPPLVHTCKDKLDAKVDMLPMYAPAVCNGLLVGMLRMTMGDLDNAIVVDHGHRDSKGAQLTLITAVELLFLIVPPRSLVVLVPFFLTERAIGSTGTSVPVSNHPSASILFGSVYHKKDLRYQLIHFYFYL